MRMKCKDCGTKMQFDGVAWYTCPDCGAMIKDMGDGTFKTSYEIFHPKGVKERDIPPNRWRDAEDGEY